MTAQRGGGWPHWTTPRSLIDALTRHLGPIGLDPCSNQASEVDAYAALDCVADGLDDGIEADWLEIEPGHLVYVNPPYARGELARWMAKCSTEAARGVEIVALVPASTGANWFHRALDSAQALALWRGRLQFGNPPPGKSGGNSSIESALIYWGPRAHLFEAALEGAARVLRLSHYRLPGGAK